MHCLLHSDYDIVHHCSIINHEGRHRLEKKAVDATLGLIRRARPSKPFIYVHTTYDYGDVRKITRDMHVIGFQTGVLMGAYPIKEVIVGFNKEDMAKQPYMSINDAKRKEIIKAVAGFEPTYDYPLEDKPKAQIISEIPEKYLRLAWFCRRPHRDQPCGICPTCKAVLPHLNKTK